MNARVRRIGLLAGLAAVCLAAGGSRASALINPNFTPVHLVNQSSLVLELHFGPVTDGKATAAVTRVLKGEFTAKTVRFDLTTSAFPAHVKGVTELAKAPGGATAVFFAGGADEDGDVAAEMNGKAYLHLAGTWVSFKAGKNAWEMQEVSETMGTTWSGGTDMLLRATEYILEDPDADVPVKEGAGWSHFERFAKLDGRVGAATPVDLAGDGTLTLHLACETGDRLFRYDAKTRKVADVTDAEKLTAKSACAAWGDFNADGRMDLVSFDGASLVIHAQDADGTFRAGQTLPKTARPDGCLSLTCVDSGRPGQPCVVIGTKRSPLVWTPGELGTVTPVGGDFAGAALGAPGTCLVADFDGDASADLLQLFEKGSLVYRGVATGRFGAGERCAPALGTGVTGAFLGDWDADGLLDVFTLSSEGASGLWNNRGRLAFVNTMTMTGELSYKGSSGATGGMTGDFNNDGRQDVLFYYASAPPRLYFNRGFRSFGLTNDMDLSTNNMLPQAEEGQQAGCLADLNGDGAQDMVLVLKNGEAWAFYVEAGEGSARCVRAVLSSKGPYIGPLTVAGWRGKRGLGAWNVTAGTSEAFFGQEEAGPISLKWQMPGGRVEQKEIVVENGPIRVVLAP